MLHFYNANQNVVKFIENEWNQIRDKHNIKNRCNETIPTYITGLYPVPAALEFRQELIDDVSFCRPLMPEPPKALPKEFQDILDKHDTVVYFSLGTIGYTDKEGLESDQTILDAIGMLAPIPVLMKSLKGGKDAPEILKLPNNVHTFQWLPQNDLLGHEKIKMFITHAGMNSLVETAFMEHHASVYLVLPINLIILHEC
eukprot:UN06799